MTYEFQYGDMQFSKTGQLDELIALDRYAMTAYEGYEKGDTVVAIVDEVMGNKKVGTIIDGPDDGVYRVKDRLGEFHVVKEGLLQKPLETEPKQFWERWAKGGASVESEETREYFENELRWLFDGYKYSMGGRIQLMLGQESVSGEKSPLTAYNCFVVRSPRPKASSVEQFLDVVEVARIEATIMRRGGGVGLNISPIYTIKGSDASPNDFEFILPKEHPDSEELIDRKLLGKFDGVRVSTETVDGGGVIVAEDSVEGLFEGIKRMVKRSYEGHTVVVDFGELRERNALVKGVNGRSSGAVSWMELYVLAARLLQRDTIDAIDFAEMFSEIVHLIIQGGSRRGALMLVCNDDSPVVHKFMERKKLPGYLTGANISVGISDSFMERVKSYKDGVVNEDTSEANRLWMTLIESAHASAEPGILLLERYNKESNSWYYNEIVSSNPCGEQGLPEFGVCNLGHFVLPTFYNEETNDVNWTDLERAIKAAVRLQDNIIDYTDYFLEENEKVQKAERRVGIGSMGLGTLLIRMGLRYGADDGNEFTDKLYKFIAYHAYKASIELAKEKGSFEKFEYDKFIQSGFMKRMLSEFPDLDEGLREYGIRNVTLLTQAPTGSTGTYIDNIPEFRKKFGGTTTGIEPYFSWKYWRAGRLGMAEQTVDLAQEYLDEHGLSDISELPRHFITAMELSPLEHVKAQAAVQKWTDSSISKTANCPRDYTVEQTDELYREAYDLGLKGMTIYRDGSRESQVLATNEEDAKLETHVEADKLKKLKAEAIAKSSEGVPQPVSTIKKVPARLYGMREKVKYHSDDKVRKAYVHIYLDEGIPVEVWIEPTEVADKDLADALGRMTTQFLRFGATENNVDQAVKHLKKGKPMFSLPTVVGRLIEQVYYGKIEMPTFTNEDKPKQFEFQKCPECGEKAYDKGNCICHACGKSNCN